MYTKFAQFGEDTLSKNPLFVIGSGLSLGAGIPGMGALADWLTTTVKPAPSELDAWTQVQQWIAQGVGLEQALQSAGSALNPELRSEIAAQTWRCIGKYERMPLLRIANGHDATGFRTLLERYSQSNHGTVDVVTPNYDHVLEWSSAMAGWAVWDGFERGTPARPISTEQWVAQMRKISGSGRNTRVEPIRHVRLYKLHGSLSWFRHQDGAILKLDRVHETELEELRLQGFSPAIVSPGNDKYLEGYSAPYFTAFSEMARAIANARSLVFIGFGFNDLHIQNGLDQKLRDPSVPKLILARSISKMLQKLISDRLLVSYVTVEAHSEGVSNISSDLISGGLVDGEYWNLKGLIRSAWKMEIAS